MCRAAQQAVHAHRTLSLYVLAGVATARGMLGAPMHLALRDSIAAGQLLGPRLLTSGPSFNNNSVTSPTVAATMVRDQKAAGYDLLKIHPGVPRAAFDSLAAVANALRIPFAGHVPLEIGLDVALTSKYSTIDHLDGIVEAMYSGPQPLTPQVNGFFGLGIMRQLDQSRFGAIVNRVKASGVAMVPTQILMDNYANDATGDELTSLPEFKYWVPQQVAAWRTNKNNFLAQPPVPREQRQEFIALRRRIIKALYDGGVPFLLGSDAPQLWNVPGFSAHRELGALVAAGLTPYQALRTGTVDVAKFLGEEGKIGRRARRCACRSAAARCESARRDRQLAPHQRRRRERPLDRAGRAGADAGRTGGAVVITRSGAPVTNRLAPAVAPALLGPWPRAHPL